MLDERRESARLALHAIVPRTTTNGPGARYGIWVQGCVRHCPGCINSATLEPLGPDDPYFEPPANKGWIDVDQLLRWIKNEHMKEPLEGITVSGGEPFDQKEPLYELLLGAKREGLSTLVFTGYTKEELLGHPGGRRFFKPEPLIDILVDGAYDRNKPVENGLRRSANQRIILLTDRYKDSDLNLPGPLECIIEPDGTIIYTGFVAPPTAMG